MENIRPVRSLVGLAAAVYLTNSKPDSSNSDYGICLKTADAEQIRNMVKDYGVTFFLDILQELPPETKATLPIIEIAGVDDDMSSADREQVNRQYIEVIASGLLELTPEWLGEVDYIYPHMSGLETHVAKLNLSNDLFDKLFINLIELIQHPDVTAVQKHILIQKLTQTYSRDQISNRVFADLDRVKALAAKMFPQLISLRTSFRELYPDRDQCPLEDLLICMSECRLFTSLDLSNQNFSNADFTGFPLDDTNFSHCELTNAIFHHTSVKNCNFDGANLDGAEFVETFTDGANFETAKLSDRTIYTEFIYDNKAIQNIFSFCDRVPTNEHFQLEAKKVKLGEVHFSRKISVAG